MIAEQLENELLEVAPGQLSFPVVGRLARTAARGSRCHHSRAPA